MFAHSYTSGLKGLFFTSIFYSSAALIAGASLCLMAPQASAQDYTSGGIEGVLIQSSGTLASGITVTIENKARGLRRSTVTDEAGRYRFSRLPIGSYELGAVAGLNTLNQQIEVRVNDLSVANFTLGTQMSDVIVTSQKTIKSDFSVAELGLINDVDRLFETQPVGRDATSLAVLAAGALEGDSAFGNLPSISGSSAGENVYYINGMNITDFRNFVGSGTVPFEFYDQVEVKTGGYGAEFGRSTGGVINAVSKSGSNEFHFGASAFWEPDSVRGTVLDRYTQDEVKLGSLTSRVNSEYNLWASGPIIKDRLFFYGLYSPRDYESTEYIFAPDSLSGQKVLTSSDDPLYAAKLDWAITENQSLEYTYINDESVTTILGNGIAFNADKTVQSVDTDGATTFDYDGGEVNVVKYTGNFTDNFSLSALYGTQTLNQTFASDADRYPSISDRRGIGTPRNPLPYVRGFIEVGEDERELLRLDADYHLQDFLGRHHFRIGLDQETLSSANAVQFQGGVRWDYYPAPDCSAGAEPSPHQCDSFYARKYLYTNGGEYQTTQTAFYIQDAWNVNDNLTLNLGLRNETFDNENAIGESFIKISDQLAARFGFGYNLDEQTQLFGNYGRYYLPVATNANIRLAGSEITRIEFFTIADELNADFTPVLTSEGYNLTQSGTGTAQDTSTTVSENLEPMFQDEFILGLRRSLPAGDSWVNGWNLSAVLTYRDLVETLEDINVDRAVIEWCAREGVADCATIWDGTHQHVLTNPGNDITVWMSEEDANMVGLAEPLRMELRAEDLGLPQPKRTYRALTLTADKEFDRGRLSLNYVLSKSEGNYEGALRSDSGQADPSATQDFDVPELTQGSDGVLPNDRTHQFMLRGAYDFNQAVRFGVNYSLSSPRSFGCYGTAPTGTNSNVATAYRNNFRYCDDQLVQRGSALDSDWINNFDLSLIATPDIMPSGTLTLRADIFNVFNAQGVTDLQEYGESAVGTSLASYGKPVGYQMPRSARFGISYAY